MKVSSPAELENPIPDEKKTIIVKKMRKNCGLGEERFPFRPSLGLSFFLGLGFRFLYPTFFTEDSFSCMGLPPFFLYLIERYAVVLVFEKKKESDVQWGYQRLNILFTLENQKHSCKKPTINSGRSISEFEVH